MVRILRKCMAFFMCLIGLLLPWRLRIIYSEVLGWLFQFIYLNYVTLLNFIIKELKKAKMEDN